MLHNESLKTQHHCGHAPPRWKLPQQLGSLVDVDLAGLSLRICQHCEGRQERKKKGWTVFKSKEFLGEEPRVVLRQDRASEGTSSP